MADPITEHTFVMTMQEVLDIVSRHVVNERLPLGSYDVRTNHQITICDGKADVTEIRIIAAET